MQTEAGDRAFDLQLEIDGKEIQNLERQYRVDSPPGGFEFNSVAGNPLGLPVVSLLVYLMVYGFY